MEFCKQDPSLKGKFNADLDPIELLIKEFHNKQLDVHLLRRMSRDFNLDHQKLLVTQVSRTSNLMKQHLLRINLSNPAFYTIYSM